MTQTEQFIEDAMLLHGDKYDYSHVVYTNSKSKIEIGCNVCLEVFEQSVVDHLSGRGCPSCAMKQRADKLRKSNDEFIERKRGDKYNSSRM